MKFSGSAIVRSFTFAAVAAASATTMAGGSLDLSLSNSSVRVAWDATRVDTGLHVNAALVHETDEGNLLSGGLHVVDVRNAQSQSYIGVGGNLYGFVGGDIDYDGVALGVGAFGRYTLPEFPDLGVYGHLYYAPPVVAFADIKNLVDADVRIQYNVLPTAHLYTGYRLISLKVDDRDDRLEFADGIHFGIRLDF
ncbi:MAG: YfaZ family outer membrane protein [Oleibacter sp.]|nr:YfaZ family outer membrane protein [Thalassolituus sp.]